MPNGLIIYPRLDTLLKEGALVMEQPASLVICAKMVALGRVDFYLTESGAGDAAWQEASVGSDVIRLPKPFERGEYFLIVSKSLPNGAALISQFNRGLKRLKDDGEYQRIV